MAMGREEGKPEEERTDSEEDEVRMDSVPKLLLLILLTLLLCAYFSPAILLIVVPWVLWWSGTLGRNRVWNTSNIQIGADVVSIAPKVYNLWITHFEVKVKFSDGSWYRTKIETKQQVSHSWGSYKTTYSYGNWELREAVARAIDAHDQVAREKYASERR